MRPISILLLLLLSVAYADADADADLVPLIHDIEKIKDETIRVKQSNFDEVNNVLINLVTVLKKTNLDISMNENSIPQIMIQNDLYKSVIMPSLFVVDRLFQERNFDLAESINNELTKLNQGIGDIINGQLSQLPIQIEMQGTMEFTTDVMSGRLTPTFTETPTEENNMESLIFGSFGNSLVSDYKSCVEGCILSIGTGFTAGALTGGLGGAVIGGTVGAIQCGYNCANDKDNNTKKPTDIPGPELPTIPEISDSDDDSDDTEDPKKRNQNSCGAFYEDFARTTAYNTDMYKETYNFDDLCKITTYITDLYK